MLLANMWILLHVNKPLYKSCRKKKVNGTTTADVYRGTDKISDNNNN